MKTTIEYSVDLQDVPAKLKSKFDDLANRLSTLSHYVDAIQQDLEHDSITAISNRLDRTRRKLLQIDTGLAECDKALQSYGDTIREIQQQRAMAAQSSEQAAPSVEGDDE